MKKNVIDRGKIQKYKNFLTSYKTIKTSLKSIIKYDNLINQIDETVVNVNKIIIHTLNFVKLYYLHNFNNENIITINAKIFNLIMKIMCLKDNRGKKPSKGTLDLMIPLREFYETNYKKYVINEKLTYTHLNTVLDYESISILTMFENHIKNNFSTFLNKYINKIVKKKEHEIKIKRLSLNKKEDMKIYKKEIRRLKADLLNSEDKCDIKYNNLKKIIRYTIFPWILTNNNKSIIYNVHVNPLNFLPTLIRMSIQLENRNESPINCFPLRKNIKPKYIKLDTTTIIHLLFTKKMNKTKYLTKNNTIKLRDKIWKFFFKTNKKMFKIKNYRFNYMISTDGVGCSILLIRKDLYKPNKRNKVRPVRKPKNYKSDRYVTDLTEEEKQELKDFMVVGIDPGKDNLIFCTNGEIKIVNGKHKTTIFRYTQDQRRKETKSKNYKKLIESIKNKVIKKLENELTKYSSKTCKYKNVKKYIEAKNRINKILYNFYKKNLFRKLKWFSFINRQKSEAKMIKIFKKIFGSPEKVIVCIGNWGANKQMKYMEPTKGKSFRELFKRNKYKTYLVDEYNTSRRNYSTGEEMEKFIKRKNPRPYKDNIRLVRGLLRSKNVHNRKSKHRMILNRDLNGSLNIRKRAVCTIRNKNIPYWLKRKFQ